MEQQNLVVVPFADPPQNADAGPMFETVLRMVVAENHLGKIKVEKVKEEDIKDEEVKEENQIATVVTVYDNEHEDENVFDYHHHPPVSLGIGEIPSGYETKQDRMELLDHLVKKFSNDCQGVRFDLVGRGAKKFIDGDIEGLFQT